MKFGVSVGRIRPEMRLAVARKAEELGYESVWMHDHLVIPARIDSVYPHNESGRAPIEPHNPFLDPLIVLAQLAGGTTRINLGTAVYILPLRPLFVTARTVLTLDVLSQSRFLFGIGVGWLRGEFEAAGAAWDHRGARTDEYLQALRVLWTAEEPELHGRFVQFGKVHFEPKPSRKHGPPIFVGGDALPALRRSAVLGDGWYAIGDQSLDTLRERIATIRQFRREAGRENEPLEVTASSEGPLTLDKVRQLSDIGVDRLIRSPWSRGSEALEGMERFADANISRIGEQQWGAGQDAN